MHFNSKIFFDRFPTFLYFGQIIFRHFYASPKKNFRHFYPLLESKNNFPTFLRVTDGRWGQSQ